MTDEHKTEELKVIQAEREAAERNRAESAVDDDEVEQHERRADKARYLREKLEERAESERRLKE
jgi:ribosomal protein L17